MLNPELANSASLARPLALRSLHLYLSIAGIAGRLPAHPAMPVASSDPDSATCTAGTLPTEPPSWSMQNYLISLYKHAILVVENENHAIAGI